MAERERERERTNESSVHVMNGTNVCMYIDACFSPCSIASHPDVGCGVDQYIPSSNGTVPREVREVVC